jgi:Flp pilus assembly protein TadG
MVTAEFAVALPAFVLVVVAAMCGVAVVTAQLRCADAAAVAARMAARGEDRTQVRAAALDGAPGSARLEVTMGERTVTAEVQARLAAPGLLSFLPAVTVESHVVEAREPAGPASVEAP